MYVWLLKKLFFVVQGPNLSFFVAYLIDVLKDLLFFLDVSSLKASFYREACLKVLARRFKVSLLSSKFEAISSSDSSLAEFQSVVKCDQMWFEILHLK